MMITWLLLVSLICTQDGDGQETGECVIPLLSIRNTVFIAYVRLFPSEFIMQITLYLKENEQISVFVYNSADCKCV